MKLQTADRKQKSAPINPNSSQLESKRRMPSRRSQQPIANQTPKMTKNTKRSLNQGSINPNTLVLGILTLIATLKATIKTQTTSQQAPVTTGLPFVEERFIKYLGVQRKRLYVTELKTQVVTNSRIVFDQHKYMFTYQSSSNSYKNNSVDFETNSSFVSTDESPVGTLITTCDFDGDLCYGVHYEYNSSSLASSYLLEQSIVVFNTSKPKEGESCSPTGSPRKEGFSAVWRPSATPCTLWSGSAPRAVGSRRGREAVTD